MSVIICRTCGLEQSLPDGQEILCCPACGTNNSRPQAEHDAGDMLRRATAQRLRCDFVHAESSYQYVLRESPDEHEALWGLVQCRYGVEYVKDPRTGKPMPIVHAVRRRPMLTDPDFREACDLAPDAIREQYRQEAAYIDGAMTKILALADKGEPCDIFLCHKTTRTDGVEGYTEDFKRATDLYIMLRDMGYHVFFAPFAGLTPGESYEAGIYHALSAAKVMLVVCSNAEYITSPWVRSEWQRFLEMSYEPGADKHLIPLLYEGFAPRRLPDDFRQLQAIAMGELDAKDKLVEAVGVFVGRSAAAAQPVPAPKPVRTAPAPKPAPQPPAGEGLVPSRAATQSTPAYAPESHFKTKEARGGVAITGYSGPGGKVLIPPVIGGKKVVEIGANAFRFKQTLTEVIIPEGVTGIGEMAFYGCHDLTSVIIPEGMTSIGETAFTACSSLTSLSIPASVTDIDFCAFEGGTDLTLRVHPNTPAHRYAQDMELPFELIPPAPPPSPASHFVFRTAPANGTCALEKYVGPGGDVVIPEAHEGYPVAGVWATAFSGGAPVSSILLPRSLKFLGANLFRDLPGVRFRVYRDSAAHAFALSNGLRVEVVD